MKQLTYKGFLQERASGEYDDALYIGDMEYPLAEEFMMELKGRQVSVRYWLSDTEKTKEQMQEGALKALVGAVDADFRHKYSEITGYLWTHAGLQIGGHNLLAELTDKIGKYIYLEIDVH